MKIHDVAKTGDVIVTTENHKFYMVQEDTSEVEQMTLTEVLEWKTKAVSNALFEIGKEYAKDCS